MSYRSRKAKRLIRMNQKKNRSADRQMDGYFRRRKAAKLRQRVGPCS